MPNTSWASRVGRPRHRQAVVGLAVAGAALVSVQARTAAPVNLRGVVSGVTFTPPVDSTPPSSSPSYYRTARVCADINDNAVCDPGEPIRDDRHRRSVLPARTRRAARR